MDRGGVNKKRAKWDECEVDFFISLLVEYDKSRYHGQNGWSKEAWGVMIKRMNEKFPDAMYTKDQLKDKECEIKKHFKIVKMLREQSGFGWDNIQHRVVAPPEVLKPIIEANLVAKRFYKKPLPHFDVLYGLYAGKYAEGKGARGVESYSQNTTPQSITSSPAESPTPTIPAPGDPSPTDWDDDFNLCEGVPADYIGAQIPSILTEPCETGVRPSVPMPKASTPTATPIAPATSAASDSRPKKRSRGKMAPSQSFLDEFLELRKHEAEQRLENERKLLAIEETKKQDNEKYKLSNCVEMVMGMRCINDEQ